MNNKGEMPMGSSNDEIANIYDFSDSIDYDDYA